MSLLRLLIIVCVICVSLNKCQHADYFLPKNVRPTRYLITIVSHNFTNYKGNVEIELQTLENTSNITLHAKNIDIEKVNVKVFDENNTEVKLGNTDVDKEKDFYIIYLNENLVKGKTYNLTICEFVGSLTETTYGFYSAKYQDSNGTDHYLALTEFGTTHARRAFPCFDEPNLKAKFTIKIVRSSSFISASNTPLQETINLENGNYLDIFKETPLMSTYLVAFILSDFKYTKENGIIRILAQPDHIVDGSTDFLLEESVKILQALEEYTGIKYPLEKIDMVAIPEKYFVDGAMENWGLITYSEKFLICHKNNTFASIQKCLTFTAHEFAHQWFGNLVTPNTWHYIWLSEGFASYFQYYIADIVKPSWRIKEQYFIEEYQTSLRFDTSPEQSVDFEFKYPSSFPSPNIYYRKASAIIRMMEHVLTDEIHRNGLRIYLENNQYKNTKPVDVYNAYEQAMNNENSQHLLGNFTIRQMLSTWTKNPSYPLVTVNRNYETGNITFSQKLFKSSKNNEKPIWHIPITYALEKNYNFQVTTTDVWLTENNITIDIGVNNDWILVNKNATGYYRVNYDDMNWARLTNFLKSQNYTQIPAVNRAQLLYDAFFLSTHNQLNYEVFFNLSSYLQQEVDYIPIYAFVDILDDADILRVPDEALNITKKYVSKMLNAINTHLKLNKKKYDSHVIRLNRDIVSKLMCHIDEEHCIKRASQKFEKWLTGKLHERPVLKKHWLCAAMKRASSNSWELLLKHYFLSNDNNIKTMYIYALTCVQNSLLLRRFVKEIFNLNNTMSAEDRCVALSHILQLRLGVQLFVEQIYAMNLDERYCFYFAELDNEFVAAPEVQREILRSVVTKLKNCIPVRFYLLPRTDFIGELTNWADKYL